ncbi:MAG TPA: hypothetical protein VJW20_07365 [Candidatus Angelobacter sp.]|nr:hypothetical protein [Candidatus Angelobacter sp.]
MSATRDLLIGTVASILAALILPLIGVVGVKFALPSLRLNVSLIEVPAQSPRMLTMVRRLIGKALLFAILLALAMASIDTELELVQSFRAASSVSSSQAAYPPDFYFSKANTALTQANLQANTRSIGTQTQIALLLQEEQNQTRLGSKDQQQQIKTITQQQIKQLLEHESSQSASELLEAQKEAEFWRTKASLIASTPAPLRQSWYDFAGISVSEALIWGIFLYGYLGYIFKMNRKTRPSLQSGMAALVVILIVSVMSLAQMNTGTLLIIEALLFSSVIYIGSERHLRVPEVLINAPNLMYQRLFLAVGLIAVVALTSFGLLTAVAGIGMKELISDLASSDDAPAWAAALPFLAIPIGFVFNFIVDFLVAFGGAIFLTSLISADHQKSVPQNAGFEPKPESIAAAKAN